MPFQFAMIVAAGIVAGSCTSIMRWGEDFGDAECRVEARRVQPGSQ
jgi:hypothetical protein